jgi:hypothetical protein
MLDHLSVLDVFSIGWHPVVELKMVCKKVFINYSTGNFSNNVRVNINTFNPVVLRNFPAFNCGGVIVYISFKYIFSARSLASCLWDIFVAV